MRLHDRNHDVVVATGRRYVDLVEQMGIPAVATGIDWDLARAEEAFPHLAPLRGVERTIALKDIFHGQAVEPFLGDLSRVAADFAPDVVVSETWEISGAAVAEAHGAAAVHLSVVALVLPAAFAIPEVVDAHLEARRLLSLDDIDFVTWAERRQTLFAMPPSWFLPGIDPGPNVTVIRPPVPAHDARDSRLPEWLVDRDCDRPLVLATLGTVFWNNPAVLERVIDAAAGEPYDMVVALGSEADPAVIDGLRPSGNVYLERYVPFGAVLPRCAAAITHGGFGTTAAALTAGVPMVVLPLGADQFVTASQVERLGIGAVVTGDDPVQVEIAGVTGRFVNAETLTAGEIRTAVRKVLTDDAVHAAVAAQRDEIEAIPEDAAAAAIEAAATVELV